MELKPCPFCGCSAVIKHLDVFGGKWFYVKCQRCYAEINNLVSSEKEAIEAWNRRVNNSDLILMEAAIEAIVFNSENKFAVDVLNDVPAVDAVPVVHGRWSEKRWMTEDDWGVINHRAIVCSACKGEIADGEKTCYCPNCGAKMDKEK